MTDDTPEVQGDPTPEPKPEGTPKRKPKGKRYVLRSIVIVILLGVLLVCLAPMGIKVAATRWMNASGAPDATIENVDFNLFTARLAVEGLNAGEGLYCGAITARVEWWPLFSRRLVVTEVAARDGAVQVVRGEDGTIEVGPLRFPPQAEPAPESTSPSWQVDVMTIDVTDLAIAYRDPLIDQSVAIDKLHVVTEGAAKQVRAEMACLKGRITVDGTVQALAPVPVGTWEIAASGVEPAALAKTLAAFGVTDAGGALDAKLGLSVAPDLAAGGLAVGLDGKASFSQPRVAAAGASLAAGSLGWNGKVKLRVGMATGVEVDGALTATEASLSAAGVDVAFDSLDLAAQDTQWAGAKLNTACQADLSNVRLSGADGMVPATALASLSIKLPRLELALAEAATRVYGQAALEGAGFHTDMPDQGVTISQDTFSFEMPRLELVLAEAATLLYGEVAMAGAGFRTDMPGQKVTLSQDTLSLEMPRLELALAEAATRLYGEVALEGAGIRADMPGRGLSVSQDSLQIATPLSLGFGPELVLDAQPDIGAEGFALTETVNGGELVKLAEMETSGEVSVEGGLSLSSLILRGLQLGTNEAGPLKVAEASALALRVGVDGASADSVVVTDAQGAIRRLKDGQLELLAMLPGTAGEEDTSPEAEAQVNDDAPYPVRLGELRLEGDNRITWSDASVSPPVKVSLASLKLGLRGLNTAAPDELSDVSLQGKLGEYSGINLEGKITLLNPAPTGTLKAKLTGVDLPVVTAYAERYAGYRIQSGLLGIEADVTLERGIVDSKNTLDVRKLKLERLKGEDLDELDQQLGMPLNAALSMLRDKNDDIHLDIPISGDIRDPEIGMGDAIRKATMKGLTKGLKTGVMAYFAPVGVAVLVGKAAKGAAALRFEPVVFEPGGDVISGEGAAYLDGLAQLLADRPKVRLNLCGMAAPPDAAIIVGEEAETLLLDLATRRAEAVKAHLVNAGEIAPERLFVCAPAIEEEPEALPRVAIRL